MERKKTVQELINALKTLRLHEADLTAQLEEAIEEGNRDNHKRGQHRAQSNPSPKARDRTTNESSIPEGRPN
jgi:hypothetical protein